MRRAPARRVGGARRPEDARVPTRRRCAVCGPSMPLNAWTSQLGQGAAAALVAVGDWATLDAVCRRRRGGWSAPVQAPDTRLADLRSRRDRAMARSARGRRLFRRPGRRTVCVAAGRRAEALRKRVEALQHRAPTTAACAPSWRPSEDARASIACRVASVFARERPPLIGQPEPSASAARSIRRCCVSPMLQPRARDAPEVRRFEVVGSSDRARVLRRTPRTRTSAFWLAGWRLRRRGCRGRGLAIWRGSARSSPGACDAALSLDAPQVRRGRGSTVGQSRVRLVCGRDRFRARGKSGRPRPLSACPRLKAAHYFLESLLYEGQKQRPPFPASRASSTTMLPSRTPPGAPASAVPELYDQMTLDCLIPMTAKSTLAGIGRLILVPRGAQTPSTGT